MPTAEKEAVVKDLAELLKRSTGVYLTDFTGLDVPSVTRLRGKLRAEGITYRVVKNRLAKLAAREAGVEGLEEVLTGPTAVAASDDDPVAPVRVLTDFSKEMRGRPVVKVGLVDGRLYKDADLEQLATLPPREVLLGQVVSAVQSPLSGLAFCLNGVLQKLVLVLNAIAEKKGESDGAA
jgi:large subunit ribosomal protein L10